MKLCGGYSVHVNILNSFQQWETHVEGGSGLVQLIVYIDHLMADRLGMIEKDMMNRTGATTLPGMRHTRS